jgi:hypothetical protein
LAHMAPQVFARRPAPERQARCSLLDAGQLPHGSSHWAPEDREERGPTTQARHRPAKDHTLPVDLRLKGSVADQRARNCHGHQAMCHRFSQAILGQGSTRQQATDRDYGQDRAVTIRFRRPNQQAGRGKPRLAAPPLLTRKGFDSVGFSIRTAPHLSSTTQGLQARHTPLRAPCESHTSRAREPGFRPCGSDGLGAANRF